VTFTISKDFEFSAAHHLEGLDPEHPCSRVHGHNYVVRLELTGPVSGPGTGATDQPGLAAALAAARATWGEHGEALLDTDRRYTPGRPVRVLIRKRGPRYDLDDRGEAVRLAGAPDGWLVAAQRAVEAESLNVNRRGVVFVPAVEGRDLVRLACRVADASLAVHAALLELDRER